MALAPNRLNVIKLCQGQTKTIELKVQTKDGRPANLSGSTIYFTAASKPGATPVIAKIGSEATPGGINFTDPANGIAVITLTSVETSVPTGCYRYDIWVEYPGCPPERQCVVHSAELRIESSITVFTDPADCDGNGEATPVVGDCGCGG